VTVENNETELPDNAVLVQSVEYDNKPLYGQVVNKKMGPPGVCYTEKYKFAGISQRGRNESNNDLTVVSVAVGGVVPLAFNRKRKMNQYGKEAETIFPGTKMCVREDDDNICGVYAQKLNSQQSVYVQSETIIGTNVTKRDVKKHDECSVHLGVYPIGLHIKM
jgi:hypothetical protein